MKIGLYDSGLGGVSVLNKVLEKDIQESWGFDYIYFGDSARAPYGDRGPEELKVFLVEILDFMQKQKVDLVVSACNTTSMFLDQIDLGKYDFPIVCLFDVMKDFFHKQNLGAEDTENTKTIKTRYAYLATSTNIDTKRYLEWGADIHPIKCPKLVPLVEAGKLEEAKLEFLNYLNEVPEGITHIIHGCTHYPFLEPSLDESNGKCFEFIDPATVLTNSKEFQKALGSFDLSQNTNPNLEIFSSGDLEVFQTKLKKLISEKISSLLPKEKALNI